MAYGQRLPGFHIVSAPHGSRFDWTERGAIVTLWGPMRRDYRARLVWAERNGEEWRAYQDTPSHKREYLESIDANALEGPLDVEDWLEEFVED